MVLGFVGSYTDVETLDHVNGTSGSGIYMCNFNVKDGSIEVLSVARCLNPSFLCISENRNFLFSVIECEEGKVAAFRINKTKGLLEPLNTVSSHGMYPCYVSHYMNTLACANYGTGNFSVYKTNSDDGRIDDTGFIWPTGSAPNPFNINTGNAHQSLLFPHRNSRISIDSDNNSSSRDSVSKVTETSETAIADLLVSDLGKDAIYRYTVGIRNNDEGSITLMRSNFDNVIACPDKAGPRHAVISPCYDVVYIMNEYNSTIIAAPFNNPEIKDPSSHTTLDTSTFVYDLLDEKSSFFTNSKTKTRRNDINHRCGGADIKVSNDGKRLYASIRNYNVIVLLHVAENGHGLKLTISQRISCGGRCPRNIYLDESHELLWVANQDSDNVSAFHMNNVTGYLSPVLNHSLPIDKNKIPSPACIQMLH